ncbi:MAG TPA: nicotinate-nucleotide--dimethylbenzimidazole phosphoribosyltransferase, partial [Gemmataceae bacterium]|nr:nicotinate-nucleotide--dimethylbenzimidazole phosphoribosyltransferase [Gemmataceae bacterium]
MNLVTQTCAAIQQVDHAAGRLAQKILDDKTKPRGSLGVLESLACRLAAIYGRADPGLPAKAIVVMAADHGVAQEGVSAYPAEVTEQMLHNFVRGGAAINVLARQVEAKVVVVNMGTKGRDKEATRQETVVHDARLGPGTANFAHGPAMSMAQALQGMETGIRIATNLCASGIGLIGVGEMGIGNTTAASALTVVFTGEAPERVTGRGTGIDDATWNHKIEIIKKALAVNQPSRDHPIEVLAKLGGFE